MAAMTGAERQARYRKNNPLAKRKHRAYMRDYMRYKRRMAGTKKG